MSHQQDEIEPGANIGDTKLVFRKLDADGSLERGKVRCVARGFDKCKNIDYFQTWAPGATLGTLCLLLALAGQKVLLVHAMDVITAFLFRRLRERVLARPSPSPLATNDLPPTRFGYCSIRV